MRQKVTLMLLAILFSLGLQAQTGGQVTGKVIDAMGELPGVSVVIKGTSNGTITDLNGQFTLPNVKPTDVLVFSFIGYKTQEVTVGSQKEFSISMVEDTQTLDEVVVVGYQEVRKRDLTGSVGEANMKDLLNTPVASFDQALGGRIAGVNVSSGEGMPGATMNITIRGNNSLTQDNTPLYIIDGFPMEDADAGSSINPSDIESINILKDASATAIYGSRGANGVVIITTKQGKTGRAQISYDGSFGVSNATKTIEMMDAYEFVKLQNEIDPTGISSTYFMNYNGKQWGLEDYRNIAQNNYQDEVFRTAWQQSHNVRLAGGSEGIRYSASVSYYDQEGILLNTDYERLQSRLNTTIKRDKLTISLNSNYSRSIQTGNSPSETSYSGMNNLFYSVWGYRPVNRPNGTLDDLLNNVLDDELDSSNDYRFNPIADLKNAYKKYYVNNLQINGYVQYEILKGLKLKVSGGYTYDNRHTDTFNNSMTRYGGPTSTDKVNAEIIRQERLTWLNENILTYNATFGNHEIGVLLGHSIQGTRWDKNEASKQGFPTDNIYEMDGGTQNDKVTGSAEETALQSFFGRINYNYGGRYLFEMNIRRDGSSRMPQANRYATFPSFSGAWLISNESFMQDINWLSSLKLRASWGKLGNQEIGNYAYASTLSAQGSYYFGDTKYVGMKTSKIANENIKWETTTITDFGIDASFWQNRINIVFDWYDKTTSDILLQLPMPGIFLGSLGAPYQNAGKVRNRGWEFAANYYDQKGDWSWQAGFSLAGVKNEILDMQGLESISNNTINREGEAIGSYYGLKAVGIYRTEADLNRVNAKGQTITQNGQKPQLGDIMYEDFNNDGDITDADRQVIGNPFPELQYSFNLGFSYKNFDVTTFWQGIAGLDRFNWDETTISNGGNKSSRWLDRWSAENPNGSMPRMGGEINNRYSSFWLTKGDYLRLKNIEIGYTFKKEAWMSKIGVQSLRLYLAGTNLLTFTSLKDYDPEKQSSDMRNDVHPNTKTYSFGINVKF